MKTLNIEVGTRIYNHGDMANVAHFGTITKIADNYITIKIDDTEKTYCIPACMFSPVFKGNGLTRIVTEKAYKEYRKEMLNSYLKSRVA